MREGAGAGAGEGVGVVVGAAWATTFGSACELD